MLGKINNRVLNLINYSLTNGVCQSLAQAMKGNPILFHSIMLDSNGIKDDDIMDLFKGMHQLEHVKSVIIKRNELVKVATVEHLIPLLIRSKPQNLEELRLINCKIGAAVTHRLVEALLKRSNVKKLGLVNANFTYSSFKVLLEYIKSSRSLLHLDLSCNSLK